MGYLQAMMDNGLNVVPELEAFVQPTIDDSYLSCGVDWSGK